MGEIITSTAPPDLGTAFLNKALARVTHPRRLMGQIGLDLAEELRVHYRRKNARPNKLGGQRTNFWNRVADSVVMGGFTDNSARVLIGATDAPVTMHINGGVIRPRRKKFLTIPVHPMAHGVRAGNDTGTGPGEFESRYGIKLFRPGKQRSLWGETPGGGGMTMFYVLASKANIPRDPDALPSVGRIKRLLNDSARRYLALEGLDN